MPQSYMYTAVPRVLHYYSFGSVMSTRSYAARAGRFEFNGKEKEADGTADNYDFGARIYDGRLGRWMSVDYEFKKYSDLSSYNFCNNNCLIYIDRDGNDFIVTDKFKEDKKSLAPALGAVRATTTGNEFISKFENSGTLSKHNLLLEKGSGNKQNNASTSLQIQVGENWVDYNGQQVDKDTKFQVKIGVQGGGKDIGGTSYIIGHEFFAHAEAFASSLESYQNDLAEAENLPATTDEEKKIKEEKIKSLNENFNIYLQEHWNPNTKEFKKSVEKEEDAVLNNNVPKLKRIYEELKVQFKGNKKQLRNLKEQRSNDLRILVPEESLKK